MARTRSSESDSDDYQRVPRYGGSASTVSNDDRSSVTDMDALFEPPVHPIAAMQGAFEESIRESAAGEGTLDIERDAEIRRQSLLDAPEYDGAWRTRWGQSPGAEHHPLWKLVAQIIFGMHLLQQRQAKSNEEVVSILQTHVNEIDGFLERTSDDFELAIADIEERIEHLRLPMAHLEVFKYMLEDTKFRMELLDGNQKIDTIIDRTFSAMNATLLDVQRGLDSVRELAKYMDRVSSAWPRDRADILEVFSAMKGNEQGWIQYLEELQRKGGRLGALLTDLRGTIVDMAKMAAIAHRQERSANRTHTTSDKHSSPLSPRLRSRFSPDLQDIRASTPDSSINDHYKPLPHTPYRNEHLHERGPAHSAAHHYERRHSEIQKQEIIDVPKQKSKNKKSDHTQTQRPKTAGGASPTKRNSSAELVHFLKSSGPLRSNPPEHMANSPKDRISRESAEESQVEAKFYQDKPGADDVAMSKRMLHKSSTMDFLNSPHEASPKHMREEGRAMSIRSAPGFKRDGQAFARRISARMKSLPFTEERSVTSSRRKFSAPVISSPSNFRVVQHDDESALYAAEREDAVPTHLPIFTKSSVPSIRSQSIRAPSIASVGRSKLRNIFQRGWRPKDPESLTS